ncbi:hypothetical protein PVAG01_11114 [Phlyctema vagabunda]|uniref:Secreted protein n=1 Tax=Phlyctema vagabunda TaxID=108571 RepID=A0ABR4P1D3_9HELO
MLRLRILWWAGHLIGRDRRRMMHLRNAFRSLHLLWDLVLTTVALLLSSETAGFSATFDRRNFVSFSWEAKFAHRSRYSFMPIKKTVTVSWYSR